MGFMQLYQAFIFDGNVMQTASSCVDHVLLMMRSVLCKCLTKCSTLIAWQMYMNGKHRCMATSSQCLCMHACDYILVRCSPP